MKDFTSLENELRRSEEVVSEHKAQLLVAEEAQVILFGQFKLREYKLFRGIVKYFLLNEFIREWTITTKVNGIYKTISGIMLGTSTANELYVRNTDVACTFPTWIPMHSITTISGYKILDWIKRYCEEIEIHKMARAIANRPVPIGTKIAYCSGKDKLKFVYPISYAATHKEKLTEEAVDISSVLYATVYERYATK